MHTCERLSYRIRVRNSDRRRRRNNTDTRNPDQLCLHQTCTDNRNIDKNHASIKTALNISRDARRSMWHKNVEIAVMNYNTTYHKR